MKLTIKGDVPSLKNSKQIYRNKRTGAPFITSSNNSKVWQRNAARQLTEQFEGYSVADYPISITLIFFYSTERRKDLDNSCSSVLDAMVAAKIIKDDDFKHIDTITLQYGGKDKADPRVEIYLDD